MTLIGSEALAITTVISDAVTELRTLVNLIDIQKKSSSSKRLDQFNIDENIFVQMNKVLNKYSCPKVKAKLVSRKAYNMQGNNSAILDPHHLQATIEDSFNTKAYTQKLKSDMIHVIEVLSQLAEEIAKTGTFQVLEQAVKQEEDKYLEIEKILESERVTRAKIKALRTNIETNQREGQELIEKSKETISHLKDQVQEMKAKTIMEERYLTQYSNVRLAELNSRWEAKKDQLCAEIKRISLLQDQESRAFEETKSYLRDRLSELNQLERYWEDRSKQDISDLQHRLDILKTSKGSDLNRLRELTVQYQEYESVVLADRIAKEKARQLEEQDELEELASQKIQNWWRTVLVRKELGPYDKKKKKKRAKGGKAKAKAKRGKK